MPNTPSPCPWCSSVPVAEAIAKTFSYSPAPFAKQSLAGRDVYQCLSPQPPAVGYFVMTPIHSGGQFLGSCLALLAGLAISRVRYPQLDITSNAAAISSRAKSSVSVRNAPASKDFAEASSLRLPISPIAQAA